MAAAVSAIRKKRLEAAQVQSVFAKYDADGSGAIDKVELMDALSNLGMAVSDAQADQVLRRYMTSGSDAGELNQEQFLRLVNHLQAMQAAAPPRSQTSSSRRRGVCGELFARMPVWRYQEKALKIYQSKWMQSRIADHVNTYATSSYFCLRSMPRPAYVLPWLLVVYLSRAVSVAALILGNFIVNIVEKEIDPYPAELQLYGQSWEDFDKFFNIIFLFELLLNAWSCGGPYKKFWSSGWNIFDFIVVAVGLLLMSGVVPPGSPLGNLKMMRAFRVFRLFKRIKSLNKVIMALLKAIPGVSNAFVIMVIFMMIYAILAVEYFAQLGQGCEGREEAGGPDGMCFGLRPYNTYLTFNEDGSNQTIFAGTSRGFSYGYEYFGTFTRALFTLFQVMTTESWSEAIARPLMFGLYSNAILVAGYFVSFILLMDIVLTNVVVAVLLDKFVEDPNKSDDGEPPPQIDAADFLGGDEETAAGSYFLGGDEKTAADSSVSPSSFARDMRSSSTHDGDAARAESPTGSSASQNKRPDDSRRNRSPDGSRDTSKSPTPHSPGSSQHGATLSLGRGTQGSTESAMEQMIAEMRKQHTTVLEALNAMEQRLERLEAREASQRGTTSPYAA